MLNIVAIATLAWALGASALALPAAAADDAEDAEFPAPTKFMGDHNVDQLKYKNSSASYVASPFLKWKSESDGKKYTYDPNVNVSSTGSYTFDITKMKAPKPDIGDEVWLVVQITAGDKVTCRKKNAKFYYAKGGGTATFRTGGTTLNNNRCKISNNSE